MTRLLTITLLLLCATGWGQQLNKGFIQTYPQQVAGLGGFVSAGGGKADTLNGTLGTLSATVVSDDTITLAWTTTSTNLKGVKVYRSTDGTTYTQVADLAKTATSYISAGLTGATRYYYKVKEYLGADVAESNAVNDWTATKFLLTSTGTGAGVSTLRLTVATTNVTAKLEKAGTFYSDAGGTADASKTWTITAGALRTIYLKVTSGTARLLVFAKGNLTTWGNSASDGWTSSTNAASATVDFTRLTNLTQLYITGASTLSNALPTGITFLYLSGNSIAWTYNGALPTGLTYLLLYGNSIAWTYNGALPSGLTYLYLYGNSIVWTYNGALPSGLTNLYLSGSSIAWTYNGALPTGLTYLYMSGNSIAWTGLDVGNTGNIGTFNLANYRVTKMSSADMVTLLTQMTNRAGTLPSTVIINDYADYASPPSTVTDAVAALKTAKSITTVTLGQ